MTAAARASVRVRALLGVVGVGTVLAGCAASSLVPGGAPSPAGASVSAAVPVTPSGPEAYADELFHLTNEARAAEGLPALAASECAEQAAVDRVTELLGGRPLEHAPMDDVLAGCAPSTEAAENLVRADAEAAAVIDAWLASSGHRANLLSESVSALGVGCRRDGSPLLCSQVFLGP